MFGIEISKLRDSCKPQRTKNQPSKREIKQGKETESKIKVYCFHPSPGKSWRKREGREEYLREGCGGGEGNKWEGGGSANRGNAEEKEKGLSGRERCIREGEGV